MNLFPSCPSATYITAVYGNAVKTYHVEANDRTSQVDPASVPTMVLSPRNGMETRALTCFIHALIRQCILPLLQWTRRHDAGEVTRDKRRSFHWLKHPKTRLLGLPPCPAVLGTATFRKGKKVPALLLGGAQVSTYPPKPGQQNSSDRSIDAFGRASMPLSYNRT